MKFEMIIHSRYYLQSTEDTMRPFMLFEYASYENNAMIMYIIELKPIKTATCSVAVFFFLGFLGFLGHMILDSNKGVSCNSRVSDVALLSVDANSGYLNTQSRNLRLQPH